MIGVESATLTAVRDLIARVLQVDCELVSPETDLKQDLGADSIDRLELATELEEMFGIVLTDEQIERIKTVFDAAAMVREVSGRECTSH